MQRQALVEFAAPVCLRCNFENNFENIDESTLSSDEILSTCPRLEFRVVNKVCILLTDDFYCYSSRNLTVHVMMNSLETYTVEAQFLTQKLSVLLNYLTLKISKTILNFVAWMRKITQLLLLTHLAIMMTTFYKSHPSINMWILLLRTENK